MVAAVSVETVTSLLSVIVAVICARWAWRADRRASTAQAVAVRTAAVADLVDGLHRLRRLARQADVTSVVAEEVVAAMVDFEDRSYRHRALLPSHLGTVGREVRAAMGNCFGGPALAGLDPRLAEQRLTTFNGYWWEITRSYLDHVDVCLQDWRTAPTRRRPTKLIRFHEWREDEDAAYFRSA